MKLTIIESPYKWKDYKELDENIKYAKECLLDCLKRWEAPLISHLLYTQVLEDKIPEERKLGIEAWLAWWDKADLTAVYTDKWISKWMEYWIERARERWRKIVYRKLNE
jgi:hypothetical protein